MESISGGNARAAIEEFGIPASSRRTALRSCGRVAMRSFTVVCAPGTMEGTGYVARHLTSEAGSWWGPANGRDFRTNWHPAAPADAPVSLDESSMSASPFLRGLRSAWMHSSGTGLASPVEDLYRSSSIGASAAHTAGPTSGIDADTRC